MPQTLPCHGEQHQTKILSCQGWFLSAAVKLNLHQIKSMMKTDDILIGEKNSALSKIASPHHFCSKHDSLLKVLDYINVHITFHLIGDKSVSPKLGMFQNDIFGAILGL